MVALVKRPSSAAPEFFRHQRKGKEHVSITKLRLKQHALDGFSSLGTTPASSARSSHSSRPSSPSARNSVSPDTRKGKAQRPQGKAQQRPRSASSKRILSKLKIAVRDRPQSAKKRAPLTDGDLEAWSPTNSGGDMLMFSTLGPSITSDWDLDNSMMEDGATTARSGLGTNRSLHSTPRVTPGGNLRDLKFTKSIRKAS